MTILQPTGRRNSATVVLGDSDIPALRRLLDADPIVNAVVAARLDAVGSLSPGSIGGSLLGIRGRSASALHAAVFNGGNLIPVGAPHAGEADWTALAHSVAQRPRVATSVVGRADAVATMWDVLAPVWGQPRAVRAEQLLLVADRLPPVAGDPEVRPAAPANLDRYMAASATMFTDELGVSPYVAPGLPAFRARVLELIAAGRAFASFDFRGQVMFKADVGVVSAHTAQVQGVWVRPDLRGRGIGTAAMATVLRYAFEMAPTVSLYVNDFNAPARRVYDKLGMRRHATLSTVLL